MPALPDLLTVQLFNPTTYPLRVVVNLTFSPRCYNPLHPYIYVHLVITGR